jgi:outer membrane protein assembly factor BamB
MSKDSSFGFRTRRGFLSSVGGVAGATLTGCLSSNRDPRYTVPSLSWYFETEGEVVDGITVDGDTGYFGSYDGRVYAVEGVRSGDLSELWEFSTYGRIFGKLVLQDGTVYFGSGDNFLYSLSAETGEKNWRMDTGGAIGGGYPKIDDGTVYVSSGYGGENIISGSDEHGKLQAVDTDTGDIIWAVKKKKGMQSPPVMDDNTLYQGCRDNNLYALDPKTGSELWKFEAGGSFCRSEPDVAHDTVYVGSEDHSMYAIDAEEGGLIWEFETGDLIASSPEVTEHAVYFGSNDNHLYAVDPDTGEEVWRFDADGKVFSSPAYRDGVVYVGCTGGELYAINAQTGEEIWRVESVHAHAINSSPVVTENMIYFGMDGSVYGIRNELVDKEEYGNQDKILIIEESVDKEEHGNQDKILTIEESD